MKPGTAEMIEGPEAFERFCNAVKSAVGPKDSIPNPFKKAKPKAKHKSQRLRV